jgi:hypothetical protein
MFATNKWRKSSFQVRHHLGCPAGQLLFNCRIAAKHALLEDQYLTSIIILILCCAQSSSSTQEEAAATAAAVWSNG